MMEGDHKGYRAGSELFVCFTSRSSSVRLASRSVLSPGRTDKFRDAPSRRLRGNGSRGQSSPMFPILPSNFTARKKNGNFEAQEPSSPKVTCIGQVRVKSKHSKSCPARDSSLRRGRSIAERVSQGSEAPKSPESHACVPHRPHQRWGHLFGFKKEVTFSICEALKSFGAEFNCFVPCGGASATGHSSKENKETTSCGAVFAKWFMVLQEGEEKKPEEQGEIGTAGEAAAGVCSDNEQIRHSFVNEDETKVSDVEEQVASPPSNALLLMRCRSKGLGSMPALDTTDEEEKEESEEEKEDSEEEKEDSEEEEEEDDKFCKTQSESEEEEQPSSSSASNYEEILEANREKEEAEARAETEKSLPNALLLMMCEPKLSLEVSKETWVSSRDFLSRSMMMVSENDKENEQGRRRLSYEEECQSGAAKSMSKLIEEKLRSPHEASFVLTRCKSEPLRASARLAPEACFWKSRNHGIPSLNMEGPLEIGAHLAS